MIFDDAPLRSKSEQNAYFSEYLCLPRVDVEAQSSYIADIEKIEIRCARRIHFYPPMSVI
jgi:hypothetical protein